MEERHCPYCGEKITGRSLKCFKCGRDLPQEYYARQDAPGGAYGADAYSMDAYSYEQNNGSDAYGAQAANSGGKVCPRCGARITSRRLTCPECGYVLPPEVIQNSSGLANPSYGVAEAGEGETVPPEEPEELIVHPTTIEELKLYGKQKGMPLIKMRFFIGVDYREPRAFGIYRDGENVIVYKNKDNGQRAIRYRGMDEAFAVNEIFQKLLDECHLRGIYPDRQPGDGTPVPPPVSTPGRRGRLKKSERIVVISVAAVIIILFLAAIIIGRETHGYYRHNDTLYYRDGSRWYYYDDGWLLYSGAMWDYEGDYLGYGYEDEYGGYDVRDSSLWDDYHSGSSDSDYDSDYDSWDSGGTDWSSDW